MERETIELITPIGGDKVLVKKWLTGGESERLQEIFLDKYESNFNDLDDKGNPKVNIPLSGKTIIEARHRTIETMILSINGKKENILQTVLDMRTEDYTFINDELNKISKKEENIEKKTGTKE